VHVLGGALARAMRVEVEAGAAGGGFAGADPPEGTR
jgi:hypothetical protein